MVKVDKRVGVFGVNFMMLRDPQQRAWLKEAMIKIRDEGGQVRCFDVIQHHSFERNETSYGAILRPAGLDQNPMKWPEEDFNRYVARMMMGPSEDEVFFNSPQALLDLIEQIDLLEECLSIAEKKEKIAEEKYEQATRKGLFRRIISAIHRELSGETMAC